MKKIIPLIIITTLIASGCKKYLDIQPIDQKPDEIAVNSFANVSAILASSLSSLGSTDIFGGRYQRCVELYGDNLDFGNPKFPTSTAEYQFFNRQFSLFTSPGSNIWTTGYVAIHRANLVIDAVDNNKFTDGTQADKNNLKGEALFIRGLLHFELCRMFSKPYSDNPQACGIVIRASALNPNDAQIKVPLNTIAECYNQAIADLSAATALLPSSRTDGHPDLWAAKAYLVKVYFDMNDFQNAFNYADDVIKNCPHQINPDPLHFMDAFSNAGATQQSGGVIFQIVNTSVYDGSGAARGDYWNSNQSFVKYTVDFSDANNLYSLLKTEGGLRFDSLVVDSFTNGTGSFVYPINNKYRGVSPAGGVAINIPVIRMAEMLLDRAECKARLGMPDADTRADYNIIRQVAATPIDNTTTGQQSLLDVIGKERRMELFLEGDRFHELRRLKMPSRGFPFNSNLLLIIPQSETNGNPNIPNYKDC